MNALDLLALTYDNTDKQVWAVAAVEETYGEDAAFRANEAAFDHHDLYRTNRGKLIFRADGVYWDPDA